MVPDASRSAPALELKGLTKDFGGQRALDGVDFDLRSGEVHALLGENGAGKSTLIKVLAGVYRADEGAISVGGAPLPAGHSPADAARLGLHFVHQDLGLVDELSVAENIALEAGFARRHRVVDMRATEERAVELLARQGVAVGPRRLVGELPQAEKVMVAIARSFFADAQAIVLDEVSASLPGPQVERITAAVRTAREGGVGFIWVTHRLDELFGFADRVTVLRDGRHVATADMRTVDRDQIVEWIVGHKVQKARREGQPSGGRPAPSLEVRGLEGMGLPGSIDLTVGRGEILGLTGLIGCGAQEVARMLGGSPRVGGGEMLLDGRPLPLGNPRKMRLAGVGYVPGDRVGDGSFPALTVRENFFPVRVGRRGDDGVISRPSRERKAAQELIERFRVKPARSSEMPLDTLSGGNQQKVIFGRSMRLAPDVLVLNDPTAGVDVGARAEIYRLIHAAAADGAVVILATTDFEEIVEQADRAIVLVDGRVAADLRGAEMTQNGLAAESYAMVDDRKEEGATA